MTPIANQSERGERGIVKRERVSDPVEQNTDFHNDNNNRDLTGYQVWRFRPEEQNNQSLWTLLTPNPITATAYFDETPPPGLGSWARKWAVKAIYAGNQCSMPAYTNTVSGGIFGGLITGIVTNADTGLPLAGVHMYITTATNQTFSDIAGFYALVYTPGSYTLHAELAGFTPNQRYLAVTNGDTTFVDMALSPVVANPEEPEIILATALKGCYPNPFANVTNISYEIKDAVQSRMEIYNLLGQKVRTLQSGFAKTGRYTLKWDGLDERQKPVTAGIYFCRMTAGDYSSIRKLGFIK
jgi:hypothetical protein